VAEAEEKAAKEKLEKAKADAKKLSKEAKIGIGLGVAASGATAASLAATGAASGIGATAAATGSALTASAAATGSTLAASGAALGSALMAPIAGLSIGVPVVAPVVVGIALIVYLLVKKHQKNKELNEVMGQAVELIMRIEKCEILMSEILLSTGYISNNVTLNRLLEELMNEIMRICPTSVLHEFEKIIDAKGSGDQRIVSELGARKGEWTLGLKKLKRFTAHNFFTKYRYSLIINKLTMINSFFSTLFAEFALTKMILDEIDDGVTINTKSDAVKGLIESLKHGSMLLKGKESKSFFGESKNLVTYSQQEPLLDALGNYLKDGEDKAKAYSKIKSIVIKNANDISAPPLPSKKGGTKKKKAKLNKKM
jgi:hypothetical protein